MNNLVKAEFRHIMAALAVTDKLSVNIESQRRANAEEGDEGVRGILFQIKPLEINTGRHFLGNRWKRHWELIARIEILRLLVARPLPR